MLLALLDVLLEDEPEVVPAALRDEDRVAEVALDLGDGDVAALGVLLAREVEVLVLNAHVPGKKDREIKKDVRGFAISLQKYLHP